MRSRIRSSARQLLLCAASFSSALCSHRARATDYWWDSDGSGISGFGSTTGTWGTSAFWSTSSAGIGATANTTTTGADSVNFGTTKNYGAGPVGIAAAGVAVDSIGFGSGQTTSSRPHLNVHQS